AQLAESMLGSAHGTSTSVAPAPATVVSTSAPAPVPQSPSLKARTSAPFLRPTIKLEPKVVRAAPAEESVKVDAVSAKTETPKVAVVETPSSTAPDAALVQREHAIAQREKELAALADALKIHEASLRDRETAIAAIEARLLNPARKSGG
ncbi:MAG TPA: hypothetical protein VK737_00660, partial [Opitutales bacterium]|nr:hypothetical protein [Opitutales bacterium]